MLGLHSARHTHILRICVEDCRFPEMPNHMLISPISGPAGVLEARFPSEAAEETKYGSIPPSSLPPTPRYHVSDGS